MTTTFGLGGGHVVALSGGVGGAKLAHGLMQALGGDRLTVVVNTADDFELYGLHISPDIDTVLYTLAGTADPGRGWGLDGDTFSVMNAVRALGEDAWFQLGDRDLATHLVRTAWLHRGWQLTAVVRQLSQRLGVDATVLPMCDEAVRTTVIAGDEEIAFQTWFARQGCQPPAESVRYDGAQDARPSGQVFKAVRDAAVILVGPSNPYLSIGPMAALPGMVELLHRSKAPVVAVSPIVGGRALKGPAADMLERIDGEASATAVSRAYAEYVDGLVIDERDRGQAAAILAQGMQVLVTDTVMEDDEARLRLAAEVLAFAAQLRT